MLQVMLIIISFTNVIAMKTLNFNPTYKIRGHLIRIGKTIARSQITKLLSTNTDSAVELTVSIEERTLACLDFKSILDSIKDNCITVLGSEYSSKLFYTNHHDINHAYAMVDEMVLNLDYIPLRNKMDANNLLRTIEINSSPEKDELAKFSEIIEEINQLRIFLIENSRTLSLYNELSKNMTLPIELIDQFEDAFEEEYQLNLLKSRSI